ncbi:Transposase DDE domain-containing protein, partial [Cetobacterium ceti]
KDYPYSTIFADKAYDSDSLISYADSLKISLICPLNKCNIKNFKISNLSKYRLRNYEFLSSIEGKKRYRKCWEVENLFGNLKGNYNIDNH